jgi:hypothetical protein
LRLAATVFICLALLIVMIGCPGKTSPIKDEIENIQTDVSLAQKGLDKIVVDTKDLAADGRKATPKDVKVKLDPIWWGITANMQQADVYVLMLAATDSKLDAAAAHADAREAQLGGQIKTLERDKRETEDRLLKIESSLWWRSKPYVLIWAIGFSIGGLFFKALGLLFITGPWGTFCGWAGSILLVLSPIGLIGLLLDNVWHKNLAPLAAARANGTTP